VAGRARALLVFGAWEHAWYLQYKNVKADYVTALWNIVNWADVALPATPRPSPPDSAKSPALSP
jgi:superoxide dismutase